MICKAAFTFIWQNFIGSRNYLVRSPTSPTPVSITQKRNDLFLLISACPANTYKTSAGSLACHPCPRNSHTNGLPGTEVQDCVCSAGYAIDDMHGGDCVGERIQVQSIYIVQATHVEQFQTKESVNGFDIIIDSSQLFVLYFFTSSKDCISLI